MKRIFTWILALLLLFSLTACGEKDTQKDPSSDPPAGEESQYQHIFDWIENGEYGMAISELERLQQEAIQKENEAKGIQEITITIDNWDQYFELDWGYNNYTNAFDEITHVNKVAVIKLKDEYTPVNKWDMDAPETSVNFEVRMANYNSVTCTADFTTGTMTIGAYREPNYYDKATNNFSVWGDPPYDCSIGPFMQISAKEGQEQVTEDTTVHIPEEVLRAEGTLYIYGK